ncbi:MAG: zinc ribbon domain-containing protein [Clostridia bacterium]|nr:zinc ribbon domain-containing protein [Clostridia bacterium]
MYCKYCGAQIADDARFCQQCGQAQDAQTAQAAQDPLDAQEMAWNDQPQETPVNCVDPAAEAKKDSLAGEALKWGILSLAFANSCVLSVLGFIFSFIARKKANLYEAEFGELEVRARLGRIFGIIGFVMGLVFSIFAVLYAIMFLVIILSELFIF